MLFSGAPVELAESRSSGSSRDASAPIFDGKNRRQWLDQLKLERKPERIAEAIRALRTLQIGEPLREEFVQLIEGVIEKFGSGYVSMVEENDKSYDANERRAIFEARWAIWTLGADHVLDLFEKLMVSPKQQERTFAYALLQQGSSTTQEGIAYDSISSDLVSKVRTRFPTLCESLARDAAQLDQAEADSRGLLMGTLFYIAGGCKSDFTIAPLPSTAESDALQQKLEAELKSHSDLLVRAMASDDIRVASLAARLAILVARDTPGLIQRLDAALGFRESLLMGEHGINAGRLAMHGLVDAKELAAPAVPSVLSLQSSDKLPGGPSVSSDSGWQFMILREHPVAARPSLGYLDYVASMDELDEKWAPIVNLAREAADAIRASLPATQFDPEGLSVRGALSASMRNRLGKNSNALSMHPGMDSKHLYVEDKAGKKEAFLFPRGGFAGMRNVSTPPTAAWLEKDGDVTTDIHLLWPAFRGKLPGGHYTHVLVRNEEIIATMDIVDANSSFVVATTTIPYDELCRLLNVKGDAASHPIAEDEKSSPGNESAEEAAN